MKQLTKDQYLRIVQDPDLDKYTTWMITQAFIILRHSFRQVLQNIDETQEALQQQMWNRFFMDMFVIIPILGITGNKNG